MSSTVENIPEAEGRELDQEETEAVAGGNTIKPQPTIPDPIPCC
jgi:hypothetical protein